MRYNDLEYPHDESGEYDFPQFLVDWLIKRYHLSTGQRVIDFGAGKGNYCHAFQRRGILASGVDIEEGVNLETDFLLCRHETFDIVFSKSTLEHIRDPANMLSEMLRLLKKGGLAIILVPDWLSQWRNFYDDSTHRTPYTAKGLTQVFQLAGFVNVRCERMTLLRLTMQYPWLSWLSFLIRIVVPACFKYWRGKPILLIRHSKELMLLLTANK